MLDFVGMFDGKFIGFRKFVYIKNGNDILKRFVFLEDLLDMGGGLVVFFIDNVGVEYMRFGVERVDGGVDI